MSLIPAGGYPYGETVTRLRALPTADPYGDTVPNWSTAVALDLPGVAVAPGTGGVTATQARNALTEARAAITVDFTLYVPYTPDIVPGDRVRVRGHDCRVIGEPQAWRSPLTGWFPGVVVAVEGIEG